jgi:transcriptional regulator with GAF, ATPase, and Fis domain
MPVSAKAAPDLGATLVELADTLVKDFDVVDFLHTLTQRCVDLVDVDAAGLALADHSGMLRVVAASNEQARLLELFEVQNEEGPCLDSFRTGHVVVEERLDTAVRWRRFKTEALGAGYHSVHAVPMRLREDVIGALNLFRVPPGLLSEDDAAICRAMADVATIGLLQERAVREARVLAEQLQVALNSRIVIEQAKGVLAEQLHIEMGAAFDLLRGFARTNNQRLAGVARDLLDARISASQLSSSAAT